MEDRDKTASVYHLTLNIGGKAHAARGFGWQTSRGTYQPAVAIMSLPLDPAEKHRSFTPSPLASHRFEAKADAVKCANDYLDRAAAQVVADWSKDGEMPVIVSPDDWGNIKLKGSQWRRLEEIAGTPDREAWDDLPTEIQGELVEQTSRYLQQNATDISGIYKGDGNDND